jgi:L-ascorbate metabolism protein UlaG (beta-lactamase superfamily)
MRDPLSRVEFFGVTATAGAAAASASSRTTVGAGGTATLKMRWYGGGIYELATPDDKSIVLVDAWIWNNPGFKAFGIEKPAELSSPAAYVAHIKSRRPEAMVVALTHDHGDHIGDYFELLPALLNAGIDVKTVGQADLMRTAFVPKFKAAGIDNTQVVLNGGQGANLGGTASYKGMRFELVTAVHSTAACYPAVGFIIDVGGARIYASGDTDVFGDMALIGSRYRPDLAVVSAGNGAFTMGPDDAALACKLVGAGHAIPVHYGHNPLVLGPQAGDAFRAAAARVAPHIAVTVMRPGESITLALSQHAAHA